MTGEELDALIKAEIGENERLHRILDRIRDGKANLTDSELYAAITAEITAKQMRRNVLSLDSREASFVDITRQRHSDTCTVFSAVQRILDAANGIHIRPQKPQFEDDRAHKIGHSLEDPTVPDSTIQRRAESATENFCRSHHDDCMKVNARFRDRAGLQCYAIRDGSAKCCDWCADVSGKYPVNETPAGFWGRHDNCKCSIQYDAKKGGRQTLRGTSKKWEVVPENAGAAPLVRLTKEQAAFAGAGAVHRMAGNGRIINAKPVQHSMKELQELSEYAKSKGIHYQNAMRFDGDLSLMRKQIDAIALVRDQFKITQRIVIKTDPFLFTDLGETDKNGKTISFNPLAFRSESETNSYLNADNRLSSTEAIGIGIHEMGHIIAKRYGEIGLDIAMKTCYNIHGERYTPFQTLDYLSEHISLYSSERLYGKEDKPFNAEYYHEIIPEVLAKHFTNPDEYTTEFMRLLREAYDL